jgi:hypothetical protein
MPDFLASIGQQITDWLGRSRSAGQAGAARKARVVDAIEQVIEGIDPRLRMVGGYARSLRPAVERALAYADEVCTRIPGPVEFSRRSWSGDPTVHALFATAEDLRRVFSRNEAVKALFAQHHPAEVTHAYVVLGMALEERHVLGVAQEGDIIRRDVPQVNVSFRDHRITRAAPDEDGLRLDLRQRALNELIAQTLRRIASMKGRREGLREERAILRLKLRTLEKAAGGLTGLMQQGQDAPAKAERIRARMAALEAECTEVKESVGTLDALLGQAATLLGEPGELIQVDTLTLRLDRMNRRHENERPTTSNPVTLARVSFGNRVTRVGILARFPRDELLPEEDFVEQAERYLMSDAAPFGTVRHGRRL